MKSASIYLKAQKSADRLICFLHRLNIKSTEGMYVAGFITLHYAKRIIKN